jgi:hypothetical protein
MGAWAFAIVQAGKLAARCRGMSWQDGAQRR